MGRFGRIEEEQVQFSTRMLGKVLPGVCAHYAVKVGEHDPDGNGGVPIISGPLVEDKKDAEGWLWNQRAYVWELPDTGEVIELTEGVPYLYSVDGPLCYHLNRQSPSPTSSAVAVEL